MSERRVPSGRGRAALAIDWWPGELPAGTVIELHTLIAHDGEVSRGTLFRRGSSSTVFCLMHPRQDVQRSPFVPLLLDAGYAVWTQTSREAGNDLRLVHEDVLLDVAAGCELLTERGYEDVVLIGMSGGAGLYSFYTEQSLTTPRDRVASTPAGTATGLADAELPPPSALVLVAPHPGQGRLLLGMIDPSVANDADPLSVIPDLDPYDCQNGFGKAPEGSHYAPEFVERYRAAQRERVARIDARAHELLADQRAARTRYKGGSDDVADMRRSTLSPIIATYRTDADLRCTDLSLDPSNRPYGSVISARPDVSNYGVTGFGRLTTPEAWLSTWSGLSSNASLERSLAAVTVPTMVVEFTGDTSVFPTDVRNALDVLAATDVQHERIEADHFGRPLVVGEESGITTAVRSIVPWVADRTNQ